MVSKCDKNEIKNKYYVVYSFCTSALGQVLRIALQDPAVLYLDLYREASLRPYRLNTASSQSQNPELEKKSLSRHIINCDDDVYDFAR